ncbi:MAG: hypothetical protein HY457_01555 [Parcubacteria group bacterium]|nr:hypothetical protein [Parcubacteria group bacterium]
MFRLPPITKVGKFQHLASSPEADQIFKECLKSHLRGNDPPLFEYSLAFSHGKKERRAEGFEWWDTPFGVVLKYRSLRNPTDPPLSFSAACIGFSWKWGAIRIEQIQGQRGYPEALKPLKWERMLVEYVTRWAPLLGATHVQIISGEDSEWYRKNNEALKKRFYLRYDVTARRLGFRWSDDANAYVLSVG